MTETRHRSIPSSKEQRDLIASLEDAAESVHVYAVSKTWYNNWQDYVGLNDKTETEYDVPGPIEMELEDKDQNVYIDEKIWKKWVQWFGVSADHELDRRTWASDEKDFEVCLLTPYSGIVENPVKTFDAAEETGYVELQMRRLFRIPEHRKSRLWVCEKIRHARFRQLLDRNKEICFQDSIDHQREYILALEVVNPSGTWPSWVPGEPRGMLDRYDDFAKLHQSSDFWEEELATTVATVFSGISNELRETATGVVHTAKCVTQQKEADLRKADEKLQSQIKDSDQVRQNLDQRSQKLSKEEDKLKVESKNLCMEKGNFEKDKSSFEEEMRKMEALNRIQESRVKLDIGGHIYTTSVLTLTKDANSMLAAMFSGRHSLRKEGDGSYFIDRDGTHFRFILNFLRDGGFRDGVLPEDKVTLNELLMEAEYYQISGLITFLTEKLQKLPDSDHTDGPNHIDRPERMAAIHLKKPLTRKVAQLGRR